MGHAAHCNAIAEAYRAIPTDPNPATEHAVGPDRGAADDTATATDHAVVANDAIVTDLNLIIDFYAVANASISQRASINAATRSYTYVYADNNAAQLGNTFKMPMLVRRITKPFRTYNRIRVDCAARTYLHPISKHSTRMYSHALTKLTIGSDNGSSVHDNPGTKGAARSDHSASTNADTLGNGRGGGHGRRRINTWRNRGQLFETLTDAGISPIGVFNHNGRNRTARLVSSTQQHSGSLGPGQRTFVGAR